MCCYLFRTVAEFKRDCNFKGTSHCEQLRHYEREWWVNFPFHFHFHFRFHRSWFYHFPLVTLHVRVFNLVCYDVIPAHIYSSLPLWFTFSIVRAPSLFCEQWASYMVWKQWLQYNRLRWTMTVWASYNTKLFALLCALIVLCFILASQDWSKCQVQLPWPNCMAEIPRITLWWEATISNQH